MTPRPLSLAMRGLSAISLCVASAGVLADGGDPPADAPPEAAAQADGSRTTPVPGSWLKWKGPTGGARAAEAETREEREAGAEPLPWTRWVTGTGSDYEAARGATGDADAVPAPQQEQGPGQEAPVAAEPADSPGDPFLPGWWRSWNEAAPPRPRPASVPGGPTVAQRAEERVERDRERRESGAKLRFGGYAEFASAFALDSPGHWTKLRGRLDVAATGTTAGGHGFKFGVRGDVDGAYMDDGHYPLAVRRDQRSDAMIREAWLDFEAGRWAFRTGRQHIVWGEMVGMFIADVVSARDTRELVLGEFDAMRIPQWAIRAERYGDSSHLEFIWIPYASVNESGEPGADFHPFPQLAAAGIPVRHVEPGHSLSDTNWGLRASTLWKGWDLSGFFYRSTDAAPGLHFTGSGAELRHDRISQAGGTFSKDLGSAVLKGEAVHTDGRSHPVAGFGAKEARTLDYGIGLDVPRGDWRLNTQLFGRYTFDHDDSFLADRSETGYSVLVNRSFGHRFEGEVLYVGSFNRSDYMLRPRLVWNILQQWRATLGVDLFGGSDLGMFGPYRDRDRVYVETRYWF